MGLITENNRQYYAGSQHFQNTAGDLESATATFDTPLSMGSDTSWQQSDPYYPLNNFKVYNSTDGGATFTEWVDQYNIRVIESVDGLIQSTVDFFNVKPAQNNIFVIQLKSLTGGQYGNRDAFGNAVEQNYGSYAYITLEDLVDNYIVGYVGDGKVIQTAKKFDILFHAKRGLQEFSYDVLKSIKTQELTVPNNLSVPIPQDYVNYVKFSWVDKLGVKHPIYPTTLTSVPTDIPLQDAYGTPVQDGFNNNIQTTSITQERWKSNDTKKITGAYNQAFIDADINQWDYSRIGAGQRYGLTPETTQVNGWFNIDHRTNKISFSSDLVNKLITFEYISDGLAYDDDIKIPKLAEDALYAYISHSIVSTRAGQPEYIVQRFKRDKSAKMRNAKIRLSNIKIEEITQVFRNKSKIIKH